MDTIKKKTIVVMYTVVPVVLTKIEWFWNFNVEISILFLKILKIVFMLKITIQQWGGKREEIMVH
jgi:hypothetical protein